MLGLILVVAIVAALAAGLSAGLAMWANALGRRTRVMIAALLASLLPMSIALVAAAKDGEGPLVMFVITLVIVVLAIVVGLPVSLAMTRTEPPAEPLEHTFE
jgi:hypothetical protein